MNIDVCDKKLLVEERTIIYLSIEKLLIFAMEMENI